MTDPADEHAGAGRGPSRWKLIAILLLGAVAFIQALLVQPRTPRAAFYDERRFVVYADNLRLHGFFGDEPGKFPADVEMRSVEYKAGVAPGMPFLLAGLRGVFGRGAEPLRVVQALAAGAATACAALLAWRLFGAAGGLLAGATLIGTGVLATYSQFGLAEVLAAAFLAGATLLVLVAFDRASWPLMLGAGALLGISALFRPQVLLLPIPLAAWIMLAPRRRAVLALALIGGTLVAVGPWTVRNYVRLHAFVPVASYTWGNLFLANNAKAGPVFVHPENVIGVDETRRIRGLPELAQEAAWRKLTLDWVSAHPADAVAGWIRNGRSFLTIEDGLIPRWYQIRARTVPRLDDRLLAPIALGGVALAAAAGLLTRRTMLPVVVVLYSILFFCFFLPIPRFRVGMTPALCVLVGALPAAIGTLAARSRTALAAA